MKSQNDSSLFMNLNQYQQQHYRHNSSTSIQKLTGATTTIASSTSTSIFDQNFYNKNSNQDNMKSIMSSSSGLSIESTNSGLVTPIESKLIQSSKMTSIPLSSSSTSSSSIGCETLSSSSLTLSTATATLTPSGSSKIGVGRGGVSGTGTGTGLLLMDSSLKNYYINPHNDDINNRKNNYLDYTLRPLQLDQKCYEQVTLPYNKHIRRNSTSNSNEISTSLPLPIKTTMTAGITTVPTSKITSSTIIQSKLNLCKNDCTTSASPVALATIISVATTTATTTTTTTTTIKSTSSSSSPLSKTKMMEFHARIQLLENAMSLRENTTVATTTSTANCLIQQTSSPKNKITQQKLHFYQTKKEIEQMLGQRFNLNENQLSLSGIGSSSLSTTSSSSSSISAIGGGGGGCTGSGIGGGARSGTIASLITTHNQNNPPPTKRRFTNLINSSSLDLSRNNSNDTFIINENINNSSFGGGDGSGGNIEISTYNYEKDHFKNLSKDKINLQNKLQEEMKSKCQKIQEKHLIERYPPQYHYGEIHNSTINIHGFPESNDKIGQQQELKQIKTSIGGGGGAVGGSGIVTPINNIGGPSVSTTTTTTTTIIDENFLVYRDGILISGPLESLIKHMVPTSNYYPDNSFIFAFLLSARLFINPYELLQRICQLCEEQQNIIVKQTTTTTATTNLTDDTLLSLVPSSLSSSSSTSSTSSSLTTTSGICSGGGGSHGGHSNFTGINSGDYIGININGIVNNFLTSTTSTTSTTTITTTTTGTAATTTMTAAATATSNIGANNSNINVNNSKNLRQQQHKQQINQSNQEDTKKMLKMFAKNFLRLLSEWVNLFSYDFRDERLMQQVRTMQQKCISIDSNLRQDVSMILQNLLEKLTILEKYENFLQSISTLDPIDFPNNINSGFGYSSSNTVTSSSNNEKDHNYLHQYHNLTSSNSLIMPVSTTAGQLLGSTTIVGGVSSGGGTPAVAQPPATSSSSSLSFHHHITGLIPSYTNHSMSSSSIGSMASLNGGVEIIEICPSSTVLSQQLTHIELERLSHIGPEEFVQVFAKENHNLNENQQKSTSSSSNNTMGTGTGRGGGKSASSATNLLSTDVKKTRNLETYVHWFNRLSYLVATEIVKYSKKKQRVRVVEYWIETARECFNIGNFNSLMAIIAGLNMSPISRLKKTWSKVQSAKFSVLEHQMDPSSNFNSYRSTLKAAMWRSAGATNERERIIIPFFSLLVKDLYFLNEGCSNRLSNGHINFEKFWQVSKQIKEFISWKEVACPFERNQKTIMYLQTNPILNENTLAIASFECEPPENQQEKERFKGLKMEILQCNNIINGSSGSGGSGSNNINGGSNNSGCVGSNSGIGGGTNNSHLNHTIPTTN